MRLLVMQRCIVYNKRNIPLEKIMNAKKKMILVAEDSGPLLNDLKTIFTEEGYGVITASNGDFALQKALTEHPDLILLDILMPRKDGMAVLQELRRDGWGKHVNVIMLTNLSDTEKMKDAKTLGAKEYLVKSDIRLEEVLAKVNNLLA